MSNKINAFGHYPKFYVLNGEEQFYTKKLLNTARVRFQSFSAENGYCPIEKVENFLLGKNEENIPKLLNHLGQRFGWNLEYKFHLTRSA